MRWIADWIMTHRSRSLASRIAPHLPAQGMIADVGSGTGHNAEEIRRLKSVSVREFDVADLHWVGPGPAIIEGSRIPASDKGFDGLLMLFVLQYPDSPLHLLKECHRVSHGPVIVLQSTYRGWWGRVVLTAREFFWGCFAWRLALMIGILRPVACSLSPRRYFQVSELLRLFTEAGFVIVESNSAEWWGLCVSRDLFVLRAEKA